MAANFDGRTRRARRCWLESLKRAQELGLPFDEALAHLELGRTSPPGREREEHLRRADELFAQMGTVSSRIRNLSLA
jgi:hypothetical protein